MNTETSVIGAYTGTASLVKQILNDTGSRSGSDLLNNGMRNAIENLLMKYPFSEIVPAIDHVFGAIPILNRYFADEQGIAIDPLVVGSEGAIGALALFTPNPDFDWESSAIVGVPSDAGIILDGKVRISASAADYILVLVRVSGNQYRLALVSHLLKGIRALPLSSGSGGAVVVLEQAYLSANYLSEEVSLDPHGELVSVLIPYVYMCAFCSAVSARKVVVAIRKVSIATSHGGRSYKLSQVVAHEITHLEVEANLLWLAVCDNEAMGDQGHASTRTHSILALATAAISILSHAVSLSKELADSVGIEVTAVAGADALPTHSLINSILGGPWMTQGWLARNMGLYGDI